MLTVRLQNLTADPHTVNLYPATDADNRSFASPSATATISGGSYVEVLWPENSHVTLTRDNGSGAKDAILQQWLHGVDGATRIVQLIGSAGNYSFRLM